jgi:glycosyltransferase involved in cell wall biosynthesis
MSGLDLLFWGRYGNYGPDYPRNRVIEAAFTSLGHRVRRFVPRISAVADLEAALCGLEKPDLVWVPCFRHRDLRAAHRYARRQQIPLVFDPLISAYDKQVSERRKFPADSIRGRRLLGWERELFSLADLVVADTEGHKDYFSSVLGVPRDRIRVVPVGAEEELFKPQPPRMTDGPLEVVFSGTFIGLHGIELVIEAAALYSGPPLRWRLLGDGPLRASCEARVAKLREENPQLDIAFENWRPLPELPARLAQADILLGIFGSSDKALRVIPNKVYQALALGRPVLTAASRAYPEALLQDENQGMFWSPPGDAQGIILALERICQHRTELPAHGSAARRTYEQLFSQEAVKSELIDILQDLNRQIVD